LSSWEKEARERNIKSWSGGWIAYIKEEAHHEIWNVLERGERGREWNNL